MTVLPLLARVIQARTVAVRTVVPALKKGTHFFLNSPVYSHLPPLNMYTLTTCEKERFPFLFLGRAQRPQ